MRSNQTDLASPTGRPEILSLILASLTAFAPFAPDMHLPGISLPHDGIACL